MSAPFVNRTSLSGEEVLITDGALACFREQLMKVRWTKGSIRLRITPAELVSLISGMPISETLRVPGVPVPIWSISIIPGSSETQLCTHSNHVRIFLSDADQTILASPLEEGV